MYIVFVYVFMYFDTRSETNELIERNNILAAKQKIKSTSYVFVS